MTTASTKAAAITVDEYERMIEDGTIGEDDPIELIEGRLVAKMTKKPDHMSSSGRARRAIESVLPSGWHAPVEGPVRSRRGIASLSRISPWSGRHRRLRGQTPRPCGRRPGRRNREVEPGRRPQARRDLWRRGNPDLLDGQSGSPPTEVYARPANGTYSSLTILKKNELVDLIIDGQTVAQIAVANLLPRR